MATFQENLSELQVPGVGHIPSGSTVRAQPSALAQGISAFAPLVGIGLKLFEESVSREAINAANDGILNILAEKEQSPGSFSQTKQDTSLVQLNVQLAKAYPDDLEAINTVFKQHTGRVPLSAKVSADFDKNQKNTAMGSAFFPNMSPAEQAEKGEEIINNLKRLEVNSAEVLAQTRKETLKTTQTAAELKTKIAGQRSFAMNIYSDIYKVQSLVADGILSGLSQLSPEGDVVLLRETAGKMNEMVIAGRNKLGKTIAGMDAVIQTEIFELYDKDTSARLKLYDAKEGPLAVEHAQTLIKYFEAQRETRLELVAPRVLEMKALLGERGIAGIAAILQAGNKVLIEPAMNELETLLLTMPRADKVAVKKAFGILQALRANSNPLSTQQELDPKKAAEYNMNQMDSYAGDIHGGEKPNTNLDNWSRETASLLTVVTKMVLPHNKATALEHLKKAGTQSALKVLSKSNPDQARYIQGASTDIAFRVVTEMARNAKDASTASAPFAIGYLPKQGIWKIEEKPDTGDPGPMQGVDTQLEYPSDSQRQLAIAANNALDVAVSMKYLDPVFAKMPDLQYKELIVRSTQALTGKNPLFKGGESWSNKEVSPDQTNAAKGFGKRLETRRVEAEQKNLYLSKISGDQQAIISQAKKQVDIGIKELRRNDPRAPGSIKTDKSGKKVYVAKTASADKLEPITSRVVTSPLDSIKKRR
jgi:hypothetical protein